MWGAQVNHSSEEISRNSWQAECIEEELLRSCLGEISLNSCKQIIISMRFIPSASLLAFLSCLYALMKLPQHLQTSCALHFLVISPQNWFSDIMTSFPPKVLPPPYNVGLTNQTDRQKDGTDSITSTADAADNDSCMHIKRFDFCKYQRSFPLPKWFRWPLLKINCPLQRTETRCVKIVGFGPKIFNASKNPLEFCVHLQSIPWQILGLQCAISCFLTHMSRNNDYHQMALVT